MRFPIISVRDKETGTEHIIGTDSHDSLHVDDLNGGIQYFNLHNCDGTERYGGYDFIGEYNEYSPYREVRFVSFDELLEIYKAEIKISCETERTIRDSMKRFIEMHRAHNHLDEDEGEIFNSGGHSRY